MKKFIFIIFSILLFSGFIFAGVPNNNLMQDKIFDVTIKMPNPYYGAIVSDFTNVTNPGSVYESSIRNNAVTNPKIANNAVSNSKISDGAIDTRKIQVDGVLTENIRDYSITAFKLANFAVTNSKIADGAVTKEKIAVKSVDHARLEVYPLDKCPANQATIIYRNNRLEWSSSVDCSATMAINGDLLPSRSEIKFESPFNQCTQSVTHTVSQTSCSGSSCLEEWSIYRSGGHDVNVQTVNNISGNRTFTFNAASNNLYQSSYDVKYKLSQPATGLSAEKIRLAGYNGFGQVSTSGCQPQVGTNMTATLENYCYYNLRVTNNNCIGSCNYTLSVNGSDLAFGSFNGNNNVIEYMVPISSLNVGQGSSGQNNWSVTITYPQNSVFGSLTSTRSHSFLIPEQNPNCAW